MITAAHFSWIGFFRLSFVLCVTKQPGDKVFMFAFDPQSVFDAPAVLQVNAVFLGAAVPSQPENLQTVRILESGDGRTEFWFWSDFYVNFGMIGW